MYHVELRSESLYWKQWSNHRFQTSNTNSTLSYPPHWPLSTFFYRLIYIFINIVILNDFSVEIEIFFFFSVDEKCFAVITLVACLLCWRYVFCNTSRPMNSLTPPKSAIRRTRNYRTNRQNALDPWMFAALAKMFGFSPWLVALPIARYRACVPVYHWWVEVGTDAIKKCIYPKRRTSLVILTRTMLLKLIQYNNSVWYTYKNVYSRMYVY